MNANMIQPGNTRMTVRKEEQFPLHLVILHDGPLALAEAKRVVHGLFSKISELDVHSDEFSFREITHPQLLTESVELAAEADLFVFATKDGSALPVEVVAWLKLWLSRRAPKETAFVALIGATNGGSLNTPTNLFLRYLAERHKLTFFSSTFTVPKQTSPQVTSSTFQSKVRYNPCPEGWGLND